VKDNLLYPANKRVWLLLKDNPEPQIVKDIAAALNLPKGYLTSVVSDMLEREMLYRTVKELPRAYSKHRMIKQGAFWAYGLMGNSSEFELLPLRRTRRERTNPARLEKASVPLVKPETSFTPGTPPTPREAYKDWQEFAKTVTPAERRHSLPQNLQLEYLTLAEVKEFYAEIRANYNTTNWD
jgi:hypothetical protein